MIAAAFDWRHAFREADALPSSAPPKEKAARGRKLERILSFMFAEAGLEPRLAYRPKGEEVDGSIWFHGRTILIEAKWTGDPHPASSLYQFKGKVDGKLIGTLGLFISVGGFSSDAVDALVAGKELNLILIDGDDLRAIVDGKISVLEALERKLRAAGDAGTPFLSLNAPVTKQKSPVGMHLVVVEGPVDIAYFESVRRFYKASKPVTFIAASGPLNMVKVTQLMLEVAQPVATLAVVVDGDVQGADRLRPELTELMTRYELGPGAVKVIVVRPDTEVALGLADPGTPWRDRRHLRNPVKADLDALVAEADLPSRAANSPALAELLRVIGVNPE